MILSEFGARKPVAASMLFLALLVLGAVSLGRLGLDLMPELEVPAISVVTVYPGAGPEEVEDQVTRPVENQMSTVGGVDSVVATSSQDTSVVTLRFDWGVNLEEKTGEVRDRIGLLEGSLPDEARRPFVFKFDMSMIPVLYAGVEAGPSYEELYDRFDREVRRRLEQLPGVASVSVYGGERREIRVEADAGRLEAYGLTVGGLSGAVRQANLNLPGGFVRRGDREYVLRTPGEIGVDEIAGVIVGQSSGQPVYLGDVARVSDGFAEKSGDISINRSPGLVFVVQKQSGTNTVEVATLVNRELEALSAELPPDVRIHTIFDQSDFIRGSIGSLRDSLLFGGLLVVFVVFLFVRDLRSSLIIVLSIPISLVTAFILMYGAGFTLNLVSLSSLGIAVGMVVDASVVVFENILRRREAGEERLASALAGASEVAAPVVAAVLAVITVFVPVVFTGGIAGILFRQLALTFSFALLCSLFSALTLVPLLCARMLKDGSAGKAGAGPRSTAGERVLERLTEAYRRSLDLVLRRKKITLGLALLAWLGSLLLVPLIGTEFMPEVDQGLLTFEVELPPGSHHEATGRVIDDVQAVIAREVPEAEVIYSQWGRLSGAGGVMMGGGMDGHRGRVMVKLTGLSGRERTSRRVAQELRRHMNFPGARVIFEASDPMARMLGGGGRPLAVELRGYDLDDGRRAAGLVSEMLEGIEGVHDVTISREEGRPERQILVDRERAGRLGLSVSGVAGQVRTAFEGDSTNKLRERGEEYDIMIRLREEDRSAEGALEGLLVQSPAGLVRLSEIARVREETGPVTIERRDQERVIEVSGEIFGRSLGEVVRDAREGLSRLEMPGGITASFAGAREDQEEAFRTMTFALFMAILLVYMVMASQFESFLDPFVIMLSLPFTVVGVLWSLFLTGNTLSLTSFLGLIMLVGIVEQTGIVLVSFITLLCRRGIPLREAIIEAARLRLRPILMTGLTTIFGMLPLAFSTGESAEFFRPLAIVVIGGLVVAVLTTLYLVPVFYLLMEERVKKNGGCPAGQGGASHPAPRGQPAGR